MFFYLKKNALVENGSIGSFQGGIPYRQSSVNVVFR